VCPQIFIQDDSDDVIRRRCFFCFKQDSSVREQGCMVTASCEGVVWVCSGCRIDDVNIPCPYCWSDICGQQCIKCEDKASFGDRMANRLCSTCHTAQRK
jgi:hypothetical protein